jgi:hypothetical protein
LAGPRQGLWTGVAALVHRFTVDRGSGRGMRAVAPLSASRRARYTALRGTGTRAESGGGLRAARRGQCARWSWLGEGRGVRSTQRAARRRPRNSGEGLREIERERTCRGHLRVRCDREVQGGLTLARSAAERGDGDEDERRRLSGLELALGLCVRNWRRIGLCRGHAGGGRELFKGR